MTNIRFPLPHYQVLPWVGWRKGLNINIWMFSFMNIHLVGWIKSQSKLNLIGFEDLMGFPLINNKMA